MRQLKLLLLWSCKQLGLFRVARFMTRKRLKILCYHGFAAGDEADFRPKLFITPETFSARLASIDSSKFKVIPLEEAVRLLYERRLPNNSLVLTVDDGFENFFHLALPQLKSHHLPAAVYVATYYVEKGVPIYRLVVQYLFWATRERSVAANTIGGLARLGLDVGQLELSEELMWKIIDFGESECSEDERQVICEELSGLLKISLSGVFSLRKFHLMNPAQLSALSESGISVQLHTHRHRFPAADESTAKREIADNRAALSRWCVSGLDHFCYPSGLWNDKQGAWLDAIGVKSSVTCLLGSNTAQTPRHALRRILDGENVHQLEFDAAVCGFTELLKGAFLRQR
jgi:peptidoglycan/xylan/chitin deacetylase (PgdA/CDA1 family)